MEEDKAEGRELRGARSEVSGACRLGRQVGRPRWHYADRQASGGRLLQRGVKLADFNA